MKSFFVRFTKLQSTFSPKGKSKLPISEHKDSPFDSWDLFPNDLQDRVIEILSIYYEAELKTAGVRKINYHSSFPTIF